MRKKILVLVAVAALAALLVSVAQAAPPSGKKGNSTQASTLLVQKDTTTWVELPFPGGTFGQVKYDTADGSAMKIQLHGLTPNNWYLVAFQDTVTKNQFSANGASCLFGVKTQAWGQWCDVALVKTNGGGQAKAIIPTDAGLTGAGAPVCANGNVPALQTGPSLGSGTYSGITVVVKDVLVGADGTTPDCGALIAGGTPVLFEKQALETFAAP
jgi:hypothetical protein